MLKQEPDIYVFKRLNKGDIDALEILFKRYYESLCNFAATFLNDKSLSEDIVTDVFLMLWEKREKINIKSNLKSYFFMTTKNAVLEYLRKNKIYFEDLTQVKGKFTTQDACYDIQKKESKQIIEELLNKIPPKSRRVFLMHRQNGLKYREIAEVLDISIKTVENHIAKALKILRENKEIINRLLGMLLIELIL